MNKDGKVANARHLPHRRHGNQVPFDDSKFQPGDEVASYFIYPLKADRADVNVALRWASGKHTSEAQPQAHHGSKMDVQFSDLNASYGLRLSQQIDNAQCSTPRRRSALPALWQVI